MKIRCLLGHRWRKVPWFKTRDFDSQWWRPDEMCMRCFKEKRYAVIRITSAEGPGIGYYGPPLYEGQPPPEGYSSWSEYRQRMKEARASLISKSSVVGKSRHEVGSGRSRSRKITPNMREQIKRRKR